MIREYYEMLRDADYRDLDWATLQTLWPTITEIALNPTSNPPAAILIYMIISMLVLMIGAAVVMFIMASDDEDEYEEDREIVAADGAQQLVRVQVVTAPDPLRHQKRFLGVLLAVMMLVIVTGASTQDDSVCTGCHAGEPHYEVVEADPHYGVSCVRCHEGAGMMGRLTVAVPIRLAHIISGYAEERDTTRLAPVTGRGCRQCHSDIADGVIEVPTRGLLVSHAEPLEAGAGCLDCHELDAGGTLAHSTAGMGPCLRCHNNQQASAECYVCHTGDVSQAAIASQSRGERLGRVLVPDPDCYSCHETASCDSCHGVRLPHPRDYVMDGHMRDAAADIWATGGRTCFACHTETNRSCYTAGCHQLQMPYHFEGDFRSEHKTRPPNDCDGCHNRFGIYDNACQLCHEEMR